MLQMLVPGFARSGAIVLMLILGGSTLLLLKPGESSVAREERPVIYDSSETDWDDYLWPTDAGTVRTSDFAEFRKTHFHAGIDVSTGGRIGFKVFASRAGWLHSLTFEPGGYGWFLVLRHADGYYTCYAHLDTPTDTIVTAWYAKLRAEGRSFGDATWDKGHFPVKKGQVIAYTGETGAGPAHLHFEIRDRNFNPVNPGLSKNLRPVDSLAPEIKGVMLVPLDAGATVDGQWTSKPLAPSGSGSAMTARGVPVLRGRVGIMLRAHDRANGATDYPTPYRLRLFVDGKEYFSSSVMRFADTLGWYIRIDRDHGLMQNLKGEYRKLYREEGNGLEFYFPQQLEAGILSAENLGAGRKAIKIVAEDLAGNKSTLLMNVMLAHDFQVEQSASETALNLRLATAAGCRSLSLLDVSTGQSAPLSTWTPEEAVAGVAVDLVRHRGKTLRIVTEDVAGNDQIHGMFVPGGASRAAGRLYQRRELLFDEIVYDLRLSAPFGSPPEVRLISGDKSEAGRVYPLDASRYRAVLKAWQGLRGSSTVEVRYAVGPKTIVWTDTLQLFQIDARGGGQIKSADKSFVLSFGPGDVYRSMLCGVERRPGDSILSFRVTPDDLPIAGRPLASIAFTGHAARSFLAVDSPMRKYGPEAGVPGQTVASRVGRFLGTYAVRTDTTGPSLIVDLARKSREPIRIVVRDTLSGVELRSVVARIDGEIVPLHFDEHRSQLYVPASVYKQFKGNELVVTATDKVGNRTRVTRSLK